MATANEVLFDRAVRHQIDVRRYTNTELRRVAAYLERADARTAEMVRSMLPKIGVKAGVKIVPEIDMTEAQKRRYLQLLADIRELRQAAISEMRKRFNKDSVELVKVEADFEASLLNMSIPIAEVSAATVSAAQVRSVVFQQPFRGKVLKKWMDELAVKDRQVVDATIRNGFVEGQTTDDMVRALVGTRSAGYANGATALTRRSAAGIVRTATNAFATGAREEVWKANSDIIVGMRWTSILDGRTTDICMGRDGKLAPVGEGTPPQGTPLLDPPGARPPAHFNCRSMMVPVLDYENVAGERPFITDTRNRRQREVDFRADAKRKAGAEKWKGLSRSERNDLIKKQRKQWSLENIGRVPAKMTYQTWLKRQPAKFQDEVLGKTKGALFRRGKLRLDQFTDRAGNSLTLKQLKSRYPDAFEEANIELA